MRDYDEGLEEAAIKSWLLFNHSNIKKNRDKFFTISVLSVLLNGGKGGKTREELVKEYTDRYGKDVDPAKIYSKLDNLLNNGIIETNDEGEYSVPKKALDRVDENKQTEKKEINEIALKIITASEAITKRRVNNREQLRINICGCIHYYFRSSCHAMLGMDSVKDINQMSKLQEKLSKGMKDKDYDSSVIIGELGSELAEASRSRLCDILARKYLAAQIVNTDPMLSEFKASVIGSKVFVLDTDTVLNILANNTPQGRAYMDMVDDLCKCGCTIYLPDQVMDEVFHVAEAACRKYQNVSYLMDNDSDTVPVLLKNLFLIDYYFLRKGKRDKCPAWENYIGNFFNPEYGVDYTYDVIGGHFKGKVHFGVPDNALGKIDDGKLYQLTEAVYQEMSKTENAHNRNESLNYEMAKSDAYFFLMVNELNKSESSRESARIRRRQSRSPLLRGRYYVISSSYRTFFCAKKIENFDVRNFTCNPKTLIMILSEIGLSQEREFSIVDVLDNPLLSKVAQVIEDDIAHLNEIGVDFTGKSLTSLRYSLHDQLDKMLTLCRSNEYGKVADFMQKKDISLRPGIQAIIDQRDEGLKREADLQKELDASRVREMHHIEEIERLKSEKRKASRKDGYIQRAFKKGMPKKRG